MSSLFNSLRDNMDAGRRGDNAGIPVEGVGLDKLGSLLAGIQPARYDLIGGGAGTGKTAFVDLFYVVAPLLYLYNNRDSPFKYTVVYNTLEINRHRKIAKLSCLLMYLLYGIVMDWKEVLSYNSTGEVLSDSRYNKILGLEEIINFLEENIIFMDGFVNPTRIKSKVDKLALENGEIKHRIRKVGSRWIKGDIPKDKDKHDKDGYIRQYFPHNPKHIFQIITDHIGLLTPEHESLDSRVLLTGKKLIDRHSKYNVYYRDFYYYSSVDVSQYNRELADVQRRRHEALTPQLEDFKESGNPAENADTVIGWINPERYNIEKYYGYMVSELPKRFRGGFVLKNRNGTDMELIATRFIGECGHFCELPKKAILKSSAKYREVMDLRNKTLYDIR